MQREKYTFYTIYLPSPVTENLLDREMHKFIALYNVPMRVSLKM